MITNGAFVFPSNLYFIIETPVYVSLFYSADHPSMHFLSPLIQEITGQRRGTSSTHKALSWDQMQELLAVSHTTCKIGFS